MYIYIYIYIFGGGEKKPAKSEIPLAHKPGLGIPTSSTPDQQPALVMPQFGERATSGPEALCGGGHIH